MTKLVQCIIALFFACASAQAQELRIAERAPPSLDPHYLFLEFNMAYGQHIFESLVRLDRNGQLVPGLATSWEAIEPTRWRFKLRPGVVFHDGKAFSADDVVYTFERIPNIPNNPSPYTPYLTSVTGVEKVDELTIDITTDQPNPRIPFQTFGILIVAKHAVEGRQTGDFTTGRAAVGTGPYRFNEHLPNERLVLVRNDAYWGEKPYWSRLTFRFIQNDAARIAALLSGDVDLIDNVPPVDAERIGATPGFGIGSWLTKRVIYLGANIGMGESPLTTDNSGRPLESNPFADARVRKAVSLAINRDAISDRILRGYGSPANQLPVGTNAHRDDLAPEPYDPEESKRLLTEAGYPDGFKTSLQCPNDRYVGDAATCQALGQMLARIGIAATVETFPSSTYFGKLGPTGVIPLFMVGWSNDGQDGTTTLLAVFHTHDSNKNFGRYNNTKYSNTEFDEIVEQASVEMDHQAQTELFQKAMRIATSEYANIPLYRTMAIFGLRDGIFCHPRVDEKLIAMDCQEGSAPN